jgi:hypothetical protein
MTSQGEGEQEKTWRYRKGDVKNNEKLRDIIYERALIS